MSPSGPIRALTLRHSHIAGGRRSLLGSVSGTSPGFALTPELLLPLNVDDYTLLTLNQPNAAPLSGAGRRA